MLDAGGDDLALLRRGRQGPVDGGVVAFRAATGEDDLARVAAEQAGHPLASLADLDSHLAAERVHARRVAVQVVKYGRIASYTSSATLVVALLSK